MRRHRCSTAPASMVNAAGSRTVPQRPAAFARSVAGIEPAPPRLALLEAPEQTRTAHSTRSRAGRLSRSCSCRRAPTALRRPTATARADGGWVSCRASCIGQRRLPRRVSSLRPNCASRCAASQLDRPTCEVRRSRSSRPAPPLDSWRANRIQPRRVPVSYSDPDPARADEPDPDTGAQAEVRAMARSLRGVSLSLPWSTTLSAPVLAASANVS